MSAPLVFGLRRAHGQNAELRYVNDSPCGLTSQRGGTICYIYLIAGDEKSSVLDAGDGQENGGEGNGIPSGAKRAAEKSEKQIPRGLKSARNDKNK
jgi:hypothetical protein